MVAALLFAAPAFADDLREEVEQEEAEQEEAEQEAEPTPSRRGISNQGLGLRVGFLLQNLSPGELTLPFRYLDLGLRYKAGEYYFDLRAPAMSVVLDGLWYVFNEFVLDRYTELFLERLNFDFAYWELAHARLGYRTQLSPPENFRTWTEPVDLAVGFFGTLDLVFLYNLRGVEREDLTTYGYDDPLVVGTGAFVALGRTSDRMQFDMSLGLGWTLRGVEENPDRRIGLILLDADFLFEIRGGFGAYIRPRATLFITRLSRQVSAGMGLTGGLNVRF